MRLKILILTLLIAATTAAAADEPALPLWKVEGQDNNVYLLGSIHLLREKDYPLPDGIYAAYEDADVLIMELDMDAIDPVATQTLTNEMGLIQDGRDLAQWMGADKYAEAEALAAEAQIPISLLSKSEPWYAAMNVEIMLLMRMGFNPALGVETHLLEYATNDGKRIDGFETMEQQLGFLDGLSIEAQRDMLLQALADGREMQSMMDGMISAWRNGDVGYMEENLLSDMQDYPELNEVIVDARNHNWTMQIVDLLDDEQDYLIVVGTLHLVGDEGVPALLEERGHTVEQIRQ